MTKTNSSRETRQSTWEDISQKEMQLANKTVLTTTNFKN